MSNVYVTVADKISATMRADKCGFDTAFASIMKNHQNLDWAMTRREVGSILGKRKKRKPRLIKIPKQLDFLFGRPREEVLADAAKQEALLTRGIPAHDL